MNKTFKTEQNAFNIYKIIYFPFDIFFISSSE